MLDIPDMQANLGKYAFYQQPVCLIRTRRILQSRNFQPRQFILSGQTMFCLANFSLKSAEKTTLHFVKNEDQQQCEISNIIKKIGYNIIVGRSRLNSVVQNTDKSWFASVFAGATPRQVAHNWKSGKVDYWNDGLNVCCQFNQSKMMSRPFSPIFHYSNTPLIQLHSGKKE
jgi:hypothetical protein